MSLSENAPASLKSNWELFNNEQKESALLLLELNQDHLFEKWEELGVNDDKKRGLLNQAKFLDTNYPGGLKAYVSNARTLLEQSKLGLNPFEGYTPSVPLGERLEPGTNQFAEMEASGIVEAYRTGFVLVAGGLGERLGYKGIKIELPSELITEKRFIELYVDYLLAIQAKGRKETKDGSLLVPLCIMTSGDTHESTVELLSANNNFGLEEKQLTIVKQEKVPSLLDNDAHFALEEDDPYQISTKPHGHGDVHTLLYQYGVVQAWVESGINWIVFFQDTNSLVFRALPAALGVSKANDFQVNSLTVARRPGEAVGAICKLDHTNGTSLTINVEYNQLEPLLKATVNPLGDVADEKTGYSPYPGNINVLIFAAKPYADVLHSTKGSIPEFVNPKYKDSTKTVFKKPTRLECMMQDYPKLLDATAKVGFTQLDRWFSFSAVKNSLEEAIAKFKTTGFPESASSGEADVYEVNRRLLSLGKSVTAEVEEKLVEYAGVPTKVGAKVFISPSFGLTQRAIADKLKNAD